MKTTPLPEELVKIRLVPIEVFGANGCNERNCKHCEKHAGYGLCDAVSSWSDCNRAVGKIYRVDEEWANRELGESIEVLVKPDNLPFFYHTFGNNDHEELKKFTKKELETATTAARVVLVAEIKEEYARQYTKIAKDNDMYKDVPVSMIHHIMDDLLITKNN